MEISKGSYTVSSCFYTSDDFELKNVVFPSGNTYTCYHITNSYPRNTYLNYAAELKHANLPSFVKNCQISGKDSFLYKEIKGVMLPDLISKEKFLNLKRAINIISGVGNALKYLYKINSKLIYQNLNPRNIFISIFGKFEKSLLFSLEKITDKEDSVWDEKHLSSDSVYYSPVSDSQSTGIKKVLYSLSAILYYLLKGKPPYADYNYNHSVSVSENLHLLEEYRHNHELDISGLHSEVVSILKTGLGLYKEKSYNSYDLFFSDLNRISSTVDTNSETSTVISSKESLISSSDFGQGFDAVVGYDLLKSQLKSDIIDVIRDPQSARNFGITIPNGILFYGPPGCGKTYIAERFAEESGFSFQYIHCSDIACPYIHGGQSKIASIFNQASKSSPSIIFFDEVDAMMVDRSRLSNASEAGEVNEFLTQINNCSESGILVIAATNIPEILDKAILRSGRIEMKFYIGEPDYQERIQLFRAYLAKKCVSDDLKYDQLASLTEHYVTADIKFITDTAARLAFRQKKQCIEQCDFIKAINTIKPSVSPEELQRYKTLYDNHLIES